MLCLGGGISRRSDVLVEPIRAFNAAHGYGRSCPKQPRIMSAELFGDAGIIGAALLGKANKESGPMRKHYERILHDSESRVQRYLEIQILDETAPSAAVSPRRTAWPSRKRPSTAPRQ